MIDKEKTLLDNDDRAKYEFRDKDIAIYRTAKGLTEDTIREISKIKGDYHKRTAHYDEELRENIRNEIKAEYDLKFYREKKIQEANGKIIPELVSGNTEEEINASVEKSMARYNEIVGAVTPPPVVNPKLNPANPSSTPLKTSSDAMKALLELDPLSKEYAEARKALGFK